MKRIINSFYHDSTKYFVSNPFPKIGDEIDVKCRFLKNDKIKDVFIRYRKFGEEVIQQMEFDYEKNGLSYYTTKVKMREDIFSYIFILTTIDEVYYFNKRGAFNYRLDNSNNFKILVNYNAPSWMSKTVFYQIIPDRFRNGDDSITIKSEDYIYQGKRPITMSWNEKPYEWPITKNLDFYGGDFYGIIEKLDYLQELGINAIYLNPIFKSPTMHKYDALDYFEIDPTLGGDEAFIELSKEIHKRGMKVILDISINHTSSSAKWFNKDGEFYDKSIGAYNNPDSEYREFYFIEDDGSYYKWNGVDTMPVLNYGSQKLRDIIYRDKNSVIKKYLKEPYNIDGWRFDVADVMARNEKLNVYYEVWEEINEAVKSVNKNALILSEEWQDAPEMYNGKRWDSTMNYFGSNLPIREFAGEIDVFTRRNEKLSILKPYFSAENLKERILQTMVNQADMINYQMFNLVNSHDITRLNNNPEISYEKYVGAITTLFGIPGAVNIYYGDEVYLDGHINSYEGCRYPMNWDENLNEIETKTHDLYKKLIYLKTKKEAFQFGGFKVIYAKGDVFAFTRFTEDEAYIIVWSKSEKEENFDIDLSEIGIFEKFEMEMGQAKVKFRNNEIISLDIYPMSTIILRME
ncbi:glycoside hydrolase family 13 protein [Helcococcus sueciensis]|uniref:glycoside hydrolase family 13 protein n=1 Tax=Helcococcus sueciensis TaxID=241555 RepID=UPI0003FB3335|nr:glycoside hydrolase family 13 protein [Helcococcus sueciensis]